MTSPATRADLERLDRDALIARAEVAGVSRANILTRPELVDELLLRTSKGDDPGLARARGFFGRARDLLARVIERGLHLPEAAELLRRAGTGPSARRTPPSAVPTVTLAEIYATQGHRTRAVETLRRVLEHEPDHAAARALLTRLSTSAGDASERPDVAEEDEPEADAAARRSSPAQPSKASKAGQPGGGGGKPKREEPAEPFGFLDDDMLPTRYDVDECVAVSVDPTTLFVYWEVRDATLAHVRRNREGGTIALRVLVVTPSWDGPMSSTRDIEIGAGLGDYWVRDLPAGAVIRTAIGWKNGDVFVPIAHSPALETPPDKPSRLLADVWLRWSPGGAAMIAHEQTETMGLPTPGYHRREPAPWWRPAPGAGAPDARGARAQRHDGAGAPMGSSELSVRPE